MKSCCLFVALFLISVVVFAQNKDVQKMVDKYERAGYQVLPGLPLMEEQVKAVELWRKMVKSDTNRLMATVTAKGSNYNAAKLQAEHLARVEIAGRVKSQIANMTENEWKTTDRGKAGSVLESSTTSNSKTIAALDLKNIEYPMELFRVLKSGETEIVLIMGCEITR